MSEMIAGGNEPMSTPELDLKPQTSGPAKVTADQQISNVRAEAASENERMKQALDGLKAGKKPAAINAEVYGDGAKAPAAKTPGGKAPASTPAPTPAKDAKTKGEPPKQASDEEPNERGLTAKELTALKRGKIDPDADVWKSVPASNLKAIARQMAESQSAADRAYQEARKGKDPTAPEVEGEEPPAEPGEEEEVTPPPAASKQQQPSQDPGNRQSRFAIDEATRTAFEDIGGTALAEPVAKAFGAFEGHVEQQLNAHLAPVTAVMHGLLQMIESMHFDSGIESLKQQAGFGQLDDAQTTAIREKAEHLLRASTKPLPEYNLRDAVAEAARVLYQPNVQQTAQQALMDRRTKALASSAYKGTTRAGPTAGKQLTGAALNQAVLDISRSQGVSYSEARRLLDDGAAV
jgi:hypothetical protein